MLQAFAGAFLAGQFADGDGIAFGHIGISEGRW
jgi:hypothetical protein